MPELLDLTRLLVILGYAVTAVSAYVLIGKANLTSHKVGILASGIISSLWVVFYVWVSLLAPLDQEQVRLASLLSRVIHAPVIASLGVMLYTLSVQIKTLKAVQKNGK